MRILSKEEATKVERPAGMAPYVWPEPVNVAISDSGKVLQIIGALSADGEPLSFAFAVNFFETLYAHGYAIVKLEDHEKGALDSMLQVADDLMLALIRGDEAEPVLERYRQMIRGLPDELVRAPERIARIQAPMDSGR